MAVQTPRVTIGLPVYNGERYVAQAIDSLLRQTYDDFELVISDNASDDGTEAICRSYAAQDRRIRYVRWEKNHGAAWNHNQVFRLARGEYFKWAADDDIHAPAFLEKCVDALDEFPDVAWCHCRSTHVGPSGSPLPNRAMHPVSYTLPAAGERSGPTRESHDASRRFKAVLLSSSCLDIYGLFRRETVAQTMLTLPYYGSEKVLLGEIALRGRYYEVPQILFFLRVHDEASGSLVRAIDQARFENPDASRFAACIRLQLLRGHIRAVLRAPIGLRQRVRCGLAIVAYLLQYRKWRSVLLRSLSGRGAGGGYLADLAQAAQKREGPESRDDGEPDHMGALNGVGTHEIHTDSSSGAL